jgi:Flp pilus assembly pilin Flp
MQHLEQFIHDTDGQDTVEYGLLVAGLGLLVLVATTSLGANLSRWMSNIATQIAST